ncbi:MAG TPA: CDP-alcohol phosphatidyltransferase family protein [Candidatus Hydrogenedentes bacterium]|nr:CDP-alcohol phosphatidyltransferase family protein [Candidatus Hydrogenedentota bacterium]HRK35021.1 CDP-alcohol phosphatidyltransferase family protein [Candidatus Hydrogenedentota bacterium]
MFSGGLNLPNQLTLARVFMVPVFVVLLSFDEWWCYWLGYAVFTVATITDYYDGKIARERNLITNFGKLLDPVADKVLVTAAFIMMMTLPAAQDPGVAKAIREIVLPTPTSAQDPVVRALLIPGWTIVAILAREFLVTGVRSLAASDGVVIAADNFGKAKTVIQMVYIFVFLFLAGAEHFVVAYAADYATVYRTALEQTSFWGMVFVALYTVYTGVRFMRANWGILQLGNRT